MKATLLLFISLLFYSFSATAQITYEREHRIKKSQFPTNALSYIYKNVKDPKRIKFYTEIDSSTTNFAAKFKKDRLWYSVTFGEDGAMETALITIKPIDIPEDVFIKINTTLTKEFSKFKIKKLQQQYAIIVTESPEQTLRNAFQNLILPTIHYKLLVVGKKQSDSGKFIILFNAEGGLVALQKALPPNYDRVLY